jgi:hypothetical protein
MPTRKPGDQSKVSPVDYWTLVEPVWLPLNSAWEDGPYEFVSQFRAVRPEIGHLYAGHWCQSEVCNGGFHQFFSNPTGLLAPEALVGYRAISADLWAELLAEAMEYFGSPYPRDQLARRIILPARQRSPREEWDPFYKLDKRFYTWTDKWEDAADAYAGRAVANGAG